MIVIKRNNDNNNINDNNDNDNNNNALSCFESAPCGPLLSAPAKRVLSPAGAYGQFSY